jgi:CHAT domain-containing protein/Tfp pilus assembly protein PilF
MRGERLRDVVIAVLFILLVPSPVCRSAFAGTDDLDTLNTQIEQLFTAGKYQQAIPLAHRALTLAERRHGLHHAKVGDALLKLGRLYREQAQYADAEQFFRRALAVNQKAVGPANRETIACLENLAQLYHEQGRFAEAEQLYGRALLALEGSAGPEDVYTVATMLNFASLYERQGRHGEAEAIFKRVLAIDEKVHGRTHAEVAFDLNFLGAFYSSQGRLADAEALVKRALEIRQKVLGPDHPYTSTSLANLALIYARQRRFAESEPLYMRALTIREKVYGPDHPAVGTSLNNLAELYRAQGRYAEADPLYKRALAVGQKVLGPDHPDIGIRFTNLAWLYFSQRDWKTAAIYWTKSTDLLIRRSRRGTETLGGAPTGKAMSEAERDKNRFAALIKTTYRLDDAEKAQAPHFMLDLFKTAQWAQSSEAATSLAQMAVRQSKGDGALARIVRERQDLVSEWQARDKVLIADRSTSAEKRNAASEAALSARLTAIDARIADIDSLLNNKFPDYAALARPEPLTVAEVQALLGNHEALLLFLDTPEWRPTPEETFIWVVTKNDFRLARSDLGTKALMTRVQALRAGLDHKALANRSGEKRSVEQLGGTLSWRNFLPFDLSLAHELYQALFGQVADLIQNNHLLIVPSGPLTSLPFQVLVTEKPDKAIPDTIEDYATAAWFAKTNAVTILPSVASLAALRRHAKGIRAPNPYIGFGNPLLTGAFGVDHRAWSAQRCSDVSIESAAQVTNAATQQRGVSDFFRGSAANLTAVRSLSPLPETAKELCDVGHSLGAKDDVIMLGEKATETVIKAMSSDGSLAKARVVHLATHGLIAGELKGLAEPALVLTPPADGTAPRALESDDGLLTSSEVAQLYLNADWVVLSACNTAAGEGGNAEALSGLARAFFFAGARALLVSHWQVNSDAAVKLATRTFSALEQGPSIGRAEGLRRAMLATISEGGRSAHPAYWAPFVVVGEGGAAADSIPRLISQPALLKSGTLRWR